jgi:hypothetical protein
VLGERREDETSPYGSRGNGVGSAAAACWAPWRVLGRGLVCQRVTVVDRDTGPRADGSWPRRGVMQFRPLYAVGGQELGYLPGNARLAGDLDPARSDALAWAT